ncbi:AgmX/PglI C-terminal domain-containing protein [Ideonella sp.]|uniref:AgmX/PglI C-terminal domain-containing protein n=1 Tax=Ideonella sp. TaxID=1929293 RepID=UPI002B48E138|nr:AgmX/PglI C-terminal domain-containing protein [Ideonella sp.]HJV70040.1 AgmX/PglI C-terminal domain-containing protein [Ideonella sp.]
MDEILKRDFQTVLAQDVDRRTFCACAYERFQLDPWLDRIADMPAEERQRPSKAWRYLDTAYFVAGLECIRPLPVWEEAGRSIDEIRAVIERHKASFWGIYNQALKSQPTLQGKVQVDFTIAPSGKVTAVRMSPSDFGGVEFAQRLGSAFLALDFGVKDVAEQTVRFPIDFLPQ